MSVHKVVRRIVKQNPISVVDADGRVSVSHMKTLPIELAVARKSAKYNRLGLFLPTTIVQEGDYVIQAGETYIVGNLSPDVHRGKVVRLVAELIWCSHLGLNAYRADIVRNAAGSMVGEGAPVTIASGINLLLTTSDLFVEGARDVDIGYWNAYISKHVPLLQAEDYITIDGRHYEVKWVKNETQGALTYRLVKRTR